MILDSPDFHFCSIPKKKTIKKNLKTCQNILNILKAHPYIYLENPLNKTNWLSIHKKKNIVLTVKRNSFTHNKHNPQRIRTTQEHKNGRRKCLLSNQPNFFTLILRTNFCCYSENFHACHT